MSQDFAHFISAFGQLKVLVLGEAMLDSYLAGAATRLCPEAPVPVVTVNHRQDYPGGATNTAVNLRGLGAKVTMLSILGQDGAGKILQTALDQQQVSTEALIHHPTRSTLTKQRLLANGQMLVRFDQGCTAPLDSETEARFCDRLSQVFNHHDAVVISDYGYGILTPAVIATLTKLQAQQPQTLVVDARNLEAYRAVGVTAVKPNYAEAVQLLGLPHLTPHASDRVAQLTAAADHLLKLTGATIAAVTLDQDGALICPQGKLPEPVPCYPGNLSQVAGAGDTFVSAFTLALAAQAPLPIAAELAMAAAAIAVAKPGTATCNPAELLSLVTAHHRIPQANFSSSPTASN